MTNNHQNSAMLTIAIPTFERNALLAKNFAAVLQQVEALDNKNDICVIIIDNASSIPVSETLDPLPNWVKIYRNPHNIGGNANILRCFELCQTPWLWIIGDDDRPEENAVTAVLNHIATNPTAAAIVFAVRNQIVRSAPFATSGLEDLLLQLDSFANLLFVPSTLYHVAVLHPQMDIGHHYAYSCAPHLSLLLTALAKHEGQVIFSSESNIAFERPDVENRGSIIPIARGLPVLLELPNLTERSRYLLSRHLSKFPSLGSLVHQTLLRQKFDSLSIRSGIRDYLSSILRLPFCAAPLRRLQAIILLPTLLMPNFSYPVIAWVFQRITGQPSGKHKLPLDRL